MRVLGEILLLALGLTVVVLVSRGLAPLAPGLGAVLRAAFHPLVLALVAVLFVLVRAGRGRRRKSAPGPVDEARRDRRDL